MLCDGLDITNERTTQHAVYCISPLRRSKILCPHLNMLDDFQGKRRGASDTSELHCSAQAVPRKFRVWSGQPGIQWLSGDVQEPNSE